MKKYCPDCRTLLVYYRALSNPTAPNEHRRLFYACQKCTDTFEKPTLISIQCTKENDPLRVVTLEITKARKALAQ